MAYVRQIWANGVSGNTPLSAARLSHIEDGIFAAVQHVNIKSHGAICDGSTNDTSAWASAVAALGSSPGVLYCPGQSVCDPDVVQLDTGQWLLGDGYQQSMVIQRAGTSGTALVASKNFATLTGTDNTSTPFNCGVRNITVNGNKANTTGTTKGVALYAYGYTLSNVRIRNARGEGIWSEWASQSVSPGNDSMEAVIDNFKVIGCSGNGIHFEGPHDTQVGRGIVAQNGSGTGYYGINIPTDGVANGSNFTQIHVWGGTYQYGVRIKSSGVRFDNFVVEGGQSAQVWIDAAQVQFLGHLYTGGVSGASAKGIVFGSSGSPSGSAYVRARIENCGGGALDLTNAGDWNDIDVQHFYYSGTTPNLAALGFVGTPSVRNRITCYVTDGTFAATVQCLDHRTGPTKWHRISSSDTRDVVDVRDESGTTMYSIDYRGRPRSKSGATPSVANGAQIGTGSPSTSVSGTDHAGTITITTGVGPLAGQLAAVTFSAAFGAAPRAVTLTPKDSGAAALQPFVTTAASAFSVRCAGSPSASTTYNFDYVVIGS